MPQLTPSIVVCKHCKVPHELHKLTVGVEEDECPMTCICTHIIPSFRVCDQGCHDSKSNLEYQRTWRYKYSPSPHSSPHTPTHLHTHTPTYRLHTPHRCNLHYWCYMYNVVWSLYKVPPFPQYNHAIAYSADGEQKGLRTRKLVNI